MTYEQRTAAWNRNQIEQRLIAAAPRVLFRSKTCAEDIQALVSFVEAEIQRATKGNENVVVNEGEARP